MNIRIVNEYKKSWMWDSRYDCWYIASSVVRKNQMQVQLPDGTWKDVPVVEISNDPGAEPK